MSVFKSTFRCQHSDINIPTKNVGQTFWFQVSNRRGYRLSLASSRLPVAKCRVRSPIRPPHIPFPFTSLLRWPLECMGRTYTHSENSSADLRVAIARDKVRNSDGFKFHTGCLLALPPTNLNFDCLCLVPSGIILYLGISRGWGLISEFSTAVAMTSPPHPIFVYALGA